ncbi:MAG: hypothetical protein ACYC09_12900 [Bacteroidota bacterium]
MDLPALVWIIVFCTAAALFFCTAAVIMFHGIQDLKDLLARSGKKSA